ncbi:MAG TPA: methyl-accepting chemotaxis protein [Anaeromyxobacteraceae bacterium]|nr:methyl-accepting chemotaxis protein [Anaeromyxobacteraceae bacterium]
MALLAKLLRSVLLSVGLAGGTAWLLVELTFDLPAEQLRWARAVVVSALAGAGVLLFALAARWSRPLRRASGGAPAGDPEKLAAALAGARLPARVAASALALGIAVAGAVVAALARVAVPGDLLAAGTVLGAAGALLAALVAHGATAAATSGAIESLGARADLGARGTTRGRVLVFALGLDTVAVLLFAASGYARYRTETIREVLADAGRGQTAAAVGKGGPPPARTVWLATGAPTAVTAPGGAVVDQAGGSLPAGLRAGAPGVERVADPPGWLVRASHAGGGDVISWIPEARLQGRWASFWIQLVVAGGVAWAAGAVLAWAASRSASLPLHGLGRAADRLAAGDLTVDPPAASQDDAGRLADDLRRIAQGLRAIVAGVLASGEGVALGAREAAAIGDRVRSGAADQRSALGGVRAAVEAVEGSVADVSRRVGGLADQLGAASAAVGASLAALEEVQARGAELERTAQEALQDADALAAASREAEGNLAELPGAAGRAAAALSAVQATLGALERAADEGESSARLVAEAAHRAGGIVEETVHGIEAVRAAVGDAQRRITALGRRSDDVEQVVDFISEVAGRTNLLSLNASIIASQAGEHGKAFAVVADQIRELAAQIARSTRSIGDIIHAVREEIEATAALIDRGDALAGEGVQLARGSLEALGGIQRSAQQGREAAEAVGTAVGVHRGASRDVAAAVESVTDGSRALASTLQQLGRNAAGAGTVARSLAAASTAVSKGLEEGASAGRRQVGSLARVERTVAEVARAVEAHVATARKLREAIRSLSDVAGRQESAADDLAGVAERLGSGAKGLSDSAGRFRI